MSVDSELTSPYDAPHSGSNIAEMAAGPLKAVHEWILGFGKKNVLGGIADAAKDAYGSAKSAISAALPRTSAPSMPAPKSPQIEGPQIAKAPSLAPDIKSQVAGLNLKDTNFASMTASAAPSADVLSSDLGAAYTPVNQVAWGMNQSAGRGVA